MIMNTEKNTLVDTNPVLSEVLPKLTQKELQVKLFVGYRDSINGYGWHVVYYVVVVKCVEYCAKCRANHNVNYKDDYYPLHHQHSHRQEYITIFEKEFMSETNMCLELLNLV